MPSDRPDFPAPSDEDVLRRRVKRELRKRMRGLRNVLPASAWQARSARAIERLANLEALAHARTVALFWPMLDRHEVDLRSLDERLRQAGVRIAYPRTHRPTVDAEAAMTFHFPPDPHAMGESTAGPGSPLREPGPGDPEAAPGELEAIVVPALAVDPRGHRIGYGAGHYDRALPRYAPPAVVIAVAFDFQLVAEVPDTPDDVAVDWIVTDARVLPREAGR